MDLFMAYEYSYLLLYGHETWYLSLKCLRVKCYIEYMDLSGRMKKSPGKHLHELYSSLLMGDQIRTIGKSVGIHLGYLCIHKDDVKMYFKHLMLNGHCIGRAESPLKSRTATEVGAGGM
jgi:hypothetical protein